MQKRNMRLKGLTIRTLNVRSLASVNGGSSADQSCASIRTPTDGDPGARLPGNFSGRPA